MNQGNGINASSTISGGSSGGGNASTSVLSSQALVVGANTKPHGVTGTVTWVSAYDANKRPLEFSDFRWDATNIYVFSDEIMTVTFVIDYL